MSGAVRPFTGNTLDHEPPGKTSHSGELMTRRTRNRTPRRITATTTRAVGTLAGGAIAALMALAPATITVTFGAPAPLAVSAQPGTAIPYDGSVCPRTTGNRATS